METIIIKALPWVTVFMIVLVFFIIFRKSINLAILHIQKVKNLKKGKHKIDVEFEEYSGSNGLEKIVSQEDESISDEVVKDKKNWVNCFVDKDYINAVTCIEKDIINEKDDGEIVTLKSIMFRIMSYYDLDKSLSGMNLLIDTQPENIVPYIAASEIFIRIGRLNSALEVLMSGLEYVNDKGKLVYKLSKIYFELNNYEDAQEIIDKHLREDEYNGDIYFMLYDLSESRKDNNPENILKEAYMKGELSDQEKLRFSAKLDSLEMYSENLYLLKTLINVEEIEIEVNVKLGNTYLMLGLNDLAIEAYRRSEALSDNENAWILECIGNLYKNRGLYTMAIENLQRAIKINDADDYAADRLAGAIKEKANEVKKEKEYISSGGNYFLK